MIHYFIQKKSREMGMRDIPALSQGALERLIAYSWPGNVRELENTAERALILSKGEPLAFHDLQIPLEAEPPFEKVVGTDLQAQDTFVLDDVVSSHIHKVLEMTGGRVGGERGAANLLKINPSTMRKRMRKLGIPFGRKREVK